MPGQRLQKAKNQDRTTKEIIGAREILKADFGSKNYIFTKEEPSVNSFKEAGYKS